MEYFTAEEAVRIVRRTPMSFVTFYDNNPNLEAIRAVTEDAESLRTPSVYAGVRHGFLLGMATGIRAERARQKERGEHVGAQEDGNNEPYAVSINKALRQAGERELVLIHTFAQELIDHGEKGRAS